MIDSHLDIELGVLTVCPTGPLSQNDFTKVAAAVDPYIEANGDLNGIIIHAESFPGWDSFAGMLSHFRFVRDHHRHIKKVAVVSDSAVLSISPHIAAHFVSAEIRHFGADEYDAAMAWIAGAGHGSR